MRDKGKERGLGLVKKISHGRGHGCAVAGLRWLSSMTAVSEDLPEEWSKIMLERENIDSLVPPGKSIVHERLPAIDEVVDVPVEFFEIEGTINLVETLQRAECESKLHRRHNQGQLDNAIKHAFT